MFSRISRLIMALSIAMPVVAIPTIADAAYGRRAAFVGGVAAAAVVGTAARAARYHYYYGAPAYY